MQAMAKPRARPENKGEDHAFIIRERGELGGVVMSKKFTGVNWKFGVASH